MKNQVSFIKTISVYSLLAFVMVFLSHSSTSFSSEDEFDFGVEGNEESEEKTPSLNKRPSFKIDINGNITLKSSRQIGSPNRWNYLGPSIKLKGSLNAPLVLLKFDGDSEFNFAFKIEKDGETFSKKHLPKSRLRELYLQKSFGKNTVYVGKKIVVWGKADALVITDVLTPKDNSLLLLTDIEKSRTGQLLLEWDFYLKNIEFNLYAIPFPLYNIYPEQGHPYGIPKNYTVKNKDEFSKKEQNSEAALRINYESDWGSTALLFASIHNREAVLDTINAFDLSFEEKHERYFFLGFTMDIALKKMLLKTEAAYEKEKLTQTYAQFFGQQIPTSMKKDVISLMGGADYNHNLWGNWILEFSGSKTETWSHLLLISWSRSFLNEDLKLNAGITFYDSLKNPSFNASSSYRISDSLETTLSCTLIDIQKSNDSNPMLSQLSGMDQVSLELKYLF